MARITTIETGLYRIPLSVTLSDSTHGEITAFELITCRVRDADSAEGVGYTYTVGRSGAAIDAVLSGKQVNPDQRASVGCRIKWKPGNEPD